MALSSIRMAERMASYLAVEVNSGKQHPPWFTGGPTITQICRDLGLTNRRYPRQALQDVVAACYHIEPSWRPTRHIQRALGWTDGRVESTNTLCIAQWLDNRTSL